jgi:hypothetical protein
MKTHDTTLLIVAVILVPPLLVASIVWTDRRSKTILRQWTRRNGYEIINAEFRYFFRGPFFWTTGKQTVFYVRVRDRHGQQRAAWVRCGSYYGGLFSDDVEFRWENETLK